MISRYGRTYKPSLKARENAAAMKAESGRRDESEERIDPGPALSSVHSSVYNNSSLSTGAREVAKSELKKAELLLQHEVELYKIEEAKRKDYIQRKKLKALELELEMKKLHVSSASVHESRTSRTQEWIRSINDNYSNESLHDVADEDQGACNVVTENVQNPMSIPICLNSGLPDLKIDVFEGNPVEWPEWHLSFTSLIESNTMLTNSQKLGYLKTFLGEEPKSRILGLLLGNDYHLAMNELQSWYGKPTLVIEAFINRVRLWPAVRKNSDLPGFCTMVSQLVQIFRTMGYKADLKAKGLLVDLTSKLPQYMKESWGRFIVSQGKGDPNVELFHKWLVDKETALRYGGGLDPVSHEPQKKQTQSKGVPHAKSSTIAAMKQNANEFVKRCPFCTGPHWLVECTKFGGKTPSDRLQWFKGEGRCFLCHKKFHRSNECVSKRRCSVNKCGKSHSPILHEALVKSDKLESSMGASVAATRLQSPTVFLQTLPVRLHTQNGRVVDTYAMLDTGSQATLIRESFAKDLGLNGPKASLCIGNIRENEAPRSSKRVSFWLSDPCKPNMTPLQIKNAWTFGSPFNLPAQTLPMNNSGRPAWEHVNDLNLTSVDPSQITILIGVDNKKAFIPLEVREGPDELPMAIRTSLGWTVMGPDLSRDTDDSNGLGVFSTHVGIDDLHEQVERFWRTDSFGTAAPSLVTSRKPYSMDDLKAQERLDSTLRQRPDGHYEVGMLWSEIPVNLENNRQLAEKRFSSLSRKLDKDPDMRTRYMEAMNGYISKGYARRLTPEETRQSSDRTYYLPHHAVINPKKPSKLRVVFDAAAVYNGDSLNKHLLTGPDLINSLVGVLMRFRCGPVAISADIEGMFHQVFVPPEDCDALRFLWKEDMALPGPPDEYFFLVHIFGARSSPCAANYCLRRCGSDNVNKGFSDQALHAIERSFYVDDMLKSLNTVSIAVEIAKELIALTKSGGMKLTKWASNNAEFLAMISELDPELGITTMLDLNLNDKSSGTCRTLGMKCDMKHDMFVFETVETKQPNTKRGILSTSSAVFDPLGLISPFVLKAKMLLQHLWEKGLEWDEIVNEADLLEWSGWCAQLNELETIQIPRCLWPVDFQMSECSLHTFCDASEKAFAAVIYLRVTSLDGQVHVSLVMSKTRVAPVKRNCLTLPRLELQAAVLGVRLHETVKSELELPIASSYFWTDSLIVLQYINNDSNRLKTFVANRVSEVRRCTDVSQWKFVPGKSNPADDGSRGLTVSELNTESRWFSGPSFLWTEEVDWPEQPPLQRLGSDNCEMKQAVTATTVSEGEQLTEPLFDIVHCSSLLQLQRRTAWCLRFVHNVRSPTEKRSGELTVSELKAALLYWVKVAQREVYSAEISCLTAGEPLPRKSKLVNLSPVLLDGVIVVGGRIRDAKVPFSARHQAIVPREHYLAELLITHAHRRTMHSGPEHTIAQLRQAYWIVKVRPLVKSLIKTCLYCSAQRAKPSVPFMADLPLARVSMNPPFTFTGLDYFGPLLIKRGLSRQGTSKRWGCLFTCLSTRAVHLELVVSLETDAFILALRRFVARRSKPSHVFSDRGTNFVGAARELKLAVVHWNSDSRVQRYFVDNGIQWHFNPPKAPHMGGAWERLVRSVKRALKATLCNALVHEDTLHTALCEVEYILNSRPLTHVSSSHSDPEPLTPNHFLLNRSSDVSSPVDEADDGLSSRKRWRQCQFLADQFWRRWRREYLPTLTVRSKWLSEERDLEIDDVCLLVDHNAPRGQWPLARVIEVMPGRDGRVRTVKVKTASGELVRPVSQICLLEEVK